MIQSLTTVEAYQDSVRGLPFYSLAADNSAAPKIGKNGEKCFAFLGLKSLKTIFKSCIAQQSGFLFL